MKTALAEMLSVAALGVMVSVAQANADPTSWTPAEQRYLAELASIPGPLSYASEGEAQLIQGGHATCGKARQIRADLDGYVDPLPVLQSVVDKTNGPVFTPELRVQMKAGIRAAINNLCPEVRGGATS
jgi:hypothetical protein